MRGRGEGREGEGKAAQRAYQAAPAGKSPACTRRPCPTAQVPRGRQLSSLPPPHRPRCHNSTLHPLPVGRGDSLVTLQLPTTHRRRPPSSCTPPPPARSIPPSRHAGATAARASGPCLSVFRIRTGIQTQEKGSEDEKTLRVVHSVPGDFAFPTSQTWSFLAIFRVVYPDESCATETIFPR